MLNISPESGEGGDVTFTVRGFRMVSAIWKVRVIGQMRVRAKPRARLHSGRGGGGGVVIFCARVCISEGDGEIEAGK